MQSKKAIFFLLSDSLLAYFQERCVFLIFSLLTTYIYGYSEVSPTLSIYYCFRQSRIQVPFGILAIPTHTDLKAGRKLQHISSLPFVIIIIISGNSKCCPMWCCTSSAPMGVPDSIKDTCLGCTGTVVTPGHFPAHLQVQEEEGHCHRGRILGLRCSSQAGDPRVLWEHFLQCLNPG